MKIGSKCLVMEEVDFQAIEALSQWEIIPYPELSLRLSKILFWTRKETNLMAEGFYLQLRKEIGKDGHWLTIKTLGRCFWVGCTRSDFRFPTGKSAVSLGNNFQSSAWALICCHS